MPPPSWPGGPPAVGHWLENPLVRFEVFEFGRQLVERRLNADPRRMRAFFRLVGRLYRRLLERCETERAAAGRNTAGERADFKAAISGGMCYSPIQLTLDWLTLSEPDDEYGLSWQEVRYGSSVLRGVIPYEDYLASDLLLLYTAHHEGTAHVSARVRRAHPSRPSVV
jgi:hypothetical protein